MSQTLKIVNICDHAFFKKTASFETVTVTRDPVLNYDRVTDLEIDSLFVVIYNDRAYFPDLHFEKFTHNKIKWICDESMWPEPSDTYELQMTIIENRIHSFDPDSCERCGGNAWYVSAVDTDDNAISTVTGVDKLLQDFMKILLTDSRSYRVGTGLQSISGSLIRSHDDAKSLIIMAIKEAEDKLKNIQYAMMLTEVEVAASELLKTVVIEDVDYIDGEDHFYARVSLINQERFSVTVGLNF